MLKEFSESNCSFYTFDTRESAKVTSLFGYDELKFVIHLAGTFSADGGGFIVANPFIDEKLTGMPTLRRGSRNRQEGNIIPILLSTKRTIDKSSRSPGRIMSSAIP